MSPPVRTESAQVAGPGAAAVGWAGSSSQNDDPVPGVDTPRTAPPSRSAMVRRDGQPEAGALGAARREADERVEGVDELVGLEARAVVAHDDPHHRLPALAEEATRREVDRAAARRGGG